MPTSLRHRSTRKLRIGGGAALLGLILAAGALPATAGAATGSVALVAYSTPKPAYAALIKAFNATPAGKSVTFSQSFGASGSQSTAVADGLPADVVNFSLAPDMAKLVKAGIVSAKWSSTPTQGMVTNSIVSFIVRKGNPKHITSWASLIKSGVGVITPNPFSSGSAKWNLMAAYGAQIHQGKTKAQATAYLAKLLKNTVAQPSSASTALQTFLSGEGDVLLDYEDDALYAQKQGEPITVIPPHPEPHRRAPERGQPLGGQGLRGLPALAGRPEGLGPAGLPPGAAQGGGPVHIPQAQDPLHHRQPRRVDQGQHGLLHSRYRCGGEDRAGAGCLHRQ